MDSRGRLEGNFFQFQRKTKEQTICENGEERADRSTAAAVKELHAATSSEKEGAPSVWTCISSLWQISNIMKKRLRRKSKSHAFLSELEK